METTTMFEQPYAQQCTSHDMIMMMKLTEFVQNSHRDMEFQIQNYIEREDEEPHSLLEEPESPEIVFSATTVRRAFIVWLYTGQKNGFITVCKYFHNLEKLEATYTAKERAASRQHEYDLYHQQPESSAFLKKYFPDLYTQDCFEEAHLMTMEAIVNDYEFITEELMNKTILSQSYDIEQESNAVNCDIETNNQNDQVTKEENTEYKILEFEEEANATEDELYDVYEIGELIRVYCVVREVPVAYFIRDFKKYIRVGKLSSKINTVVIYIKKRLVHKNIKLFSDFTYHNVFDFLGLLRSKRFILQKLNNMNFMKLSKHDLAQIRNFIGHENINLQYLTHKSAFDQNETKNIKYPPIIMISSILKSMAAIKVDEINFEHIRNSTFKPIEALDEAREVTEEDKICEYGHFDESFQTVEDSSYTVWNDSTRNDSFGSTESDYESISNTSDNDSDYKYDFDDIIISVKRTAKYGD